MADERRRGTNRVVNGNKPDKTGLEKVLENWEVLPGIMVNPRHLHFMIFVESFDPCCHQRRHSLSRATLSFSHKYPAKNVSSFSPSFYCIVVHYSHDMYRSKGKKKKERKEIKEREREKTTTRYEDKARNVRITLKFAFKIFYVFFFLLFSSFFFFDSFFDDKFHLLPSQDIVFLTCTYFFLDLMKGNAYYPETFLPYLCIRIIKINHGRTSLTNVLFSISRENSIEFVE